MARGAAPGHMHSREESRLPADLGLQILTRNQPVDNRGEVFGNAVLATAILNRLVPCDIGSSEEMLPFERPRLGPSGRNEPSVQTAKPDVR